MTEIGPRALADSMLLIVERPGITRAQTNKMLDTTIAAPAAADLVKRGLVESKPVNEDRGGRRSQILVVSVGFWALQDEVAEELTAVMGSNFVDIFEQAVFARSLMKSLLSFPVPEDVSGTELECRATVLGGTGVLAERYSFDARRWPFTPSEGWRLLVTAQALAPNRSPG